MSNEFKFQPTAIADAVQKKVVIERLPEWMQNIEHIQMYFDNAIQPWFTPEEQELVDGYVGDRGSPAATGRIFLPERDIQRDEYQLSPAYVSRNTDRSVRSLQFYPDVIGYMEHYGSFSENESRLMDGNYYAWTPAINPNKLMNFSSYVWDNNNEYKIKPDYIVMERDAANGNTWSLQNFWYTVGDTLPDGSVLSITGLSDSRFSRAAGPILEFNKDIELVNYGTRFRTVVDYYSDALKPEDIAQRRISDNIRIDGNILKEGDRVLFTSIGNSGENNRIYKIHVKLMNDGTSVYGVTLDESELSELHPTGEPIRGDVVLVRSGTEFANRSFYWNGRSWSENQRKAGINTFPKFALYDNAGVSLSDKTKYPDSTFTGSSLFGFKINFDYPIDSVYGFHIELNEHNYYVYENFMQTQVFQYTAINGDTADISGLYFYNVVTFDEDGTSVNNMKTDWVRKEHSSKQYVRQVPAITKTSMFKVFETLADLNKFTDMIETMYGYVTELDQTYQYLKANANAPLAWTPVSGDAIQSDVYSKTFQVAQRIDPTNSEEEIEIVADGVVVRQFTSVLDSDGKITSVTLGDNVDLNDESIVTIRTYSPTAVPDKTLGAYEIPGNLKNNPYNEAIDYINQGEYTIHFTEVVNKNITYGSVNEFNDYEERLRAGLVDNSRGTVIIQNEAPLLPLMVSSANEGLDIFKAIQFSQMDYFRFKNKFNTRMLTMYEQNRTGFLAKPASTIVDEIMNAINLGKDDSFPFYNSPVVVSPNIAHSFVPPTPQFFGILKCFQPQSNQYLQMGPSMAWYNIDHTGNVSKSYRALNGITLMDDVLLELETRMYNSINSQFRDVDYVPVLNSSTLRPTAYNTSTEYSASEYNTIMLRGYANFIATNGIDGSTHNYDQSKWTSWNFSGCTYVVDGQPTDIPARGSWRGVYIDMYGTWRPHTHPWEMLGFTQRPTWWNLQYEATRIQVGPEATDTVIVYLDVVENENGDMVSSGLWDVGTELGDVSKGIILQGKRAGTHAEYRRFGKMPFEIIKTGELASNGHEICTVQMRNPVDLGMLSGSLNHLAEPWVFGDMGDAEFSYMNTPMFVFDEALSLLRAKPSRFMTYYFDTVNSKLITLVGGSKQFLYKNTRERININESTQVHGENGLSVLGWQQWVSDYLTWQNKNITTNFGDVLRSSSVNIGHRIGAFTKTDNIQFSSETFGNISQENQYIGMAKSSVLKSSALSAVKITFTGTGYMINGYDLVNPYFTVNVPNKTGKRGTIVSGKRRAVQYFEYKSETEIVNYGTEMKAYQDVFNFLCGYGEFLKSEGWIFEDTNTEGEVFDWNLMAKNFLDWSSTSVDKGEYISLTTSSSSAKFGAEFGSVQSVTQFSGGVWSILDDNNSGIRPDEIDTVRIGNVFSIRTQDDSERRIALIRLNLISYEHAIVFDDKTIFGDDLYIPKYGSIYEMLKMYGYITGSWNGRLEAPGFMVLETGTLPNFEKLVNDFTQYYDNNNPVDDNTLRKLSRHLIGFQTRDYISRMITNESSQVDFYRGFIAEKGTRQSFEKVLRVSKTYNTVNYKALEEWAFKLGSFGDVDGKKHLQFKMINNEFTQEPQLFDTDADATKDSDADNTILYFGEQGKDSRWVSRPRGKFKFPMRSGRSNRINLPDIGPVTLDEVDYSTVSFDTAYSSRAAFVYQMNYQPGRVWMFRDTDQKWNIYNVVRRQVRLLRAEPIVYEGVENQYVLLTFLENHGLENGDWYFLDDQTDFMPDALKKERQYYGNTDDKNTLIVPLALANSIIFGTVNVNTSILSYNDIRLNASHPASSGGSTSTVYTVTTTPITLNTNNGVTVNGTPVSGQITVITGSSEGAVTSSYTVSTRSMTVNTATGEAVQGETVQGVITVSSGGGSGGSNNSGKITIGQRYDAVLDMGSESDIDNCPYLYVYEEFFADNAHKAKYVSDKFKYTAPESSLFDRPSTYNSLTNITELYMNIFDPINGMIPGAIMSEVKYISSYDPAMYNADNTDNKQAWGRTHVGKVWWDTTNAFYLDYTRPILTSTGTVDEARTLEYARYNWGRLMNGSSIDVYEWVASPVPPYEWDAYCTRQAKLNKNANSWVPSGEANEEFYSVFQEYDESTSAYKTVYYFWVKNSIYVPEMSSRKKTVNEIARAIKDPSVLNVPWFSPISESAFITSNLQNEITDDKSILTITWQMSSTDVVKHEQYQLCKEGLDYNFNPQVWNSMWNSLIGAETLLDGTVNNLQYPDNDFGAEPGKVWFRDIIEARREFVSAANNVYKTLNVTTDTVLMNEVFNAKFLTRNPRQVDISVVQVGSEFLITAPNDSFVENDTVILGTSGTLPKPLSSTSVYFVHIGTDGYIRLMNTASTEISQNIVDIQDKGIGSHTMVLQQYYDPALSVSLDMTSFWTYSDWYADGYNASTLYSQETSTAVADTKNYQEGDIIRVTGEDGIWTLYILTATRDKIMWEAIGRQQSTIKLSDKLFSGYDRLDERGNATADENLIRQCLTLLKETFDTLQSRLVFDMVKYVHNEQNVVDWVFKTSYIFVVGLEQSLQQNYLQQDDLITQIVAYFQEAKPYHTKIRSQIEQKTSDDDEVTGIANDLNPNGFIFINGAWEKVEKDIWDYEQAVYNEIEDKWEIQGSLPSDFVEPDRSFQQSNTQMYYDNTQVQYDNDLAEAYVHEAVNNEFVNMSKEVQIVGNHFNLSRFSFSIPSFNASSIETLMKNTLVALYPSFNVGVALADGITEMANSLDGQELSSFMSTVDKLVQSSLKTNEDFIKFKQFSQYNTLVNRLKMYTTMTDDEIASAIDAPFKGRVIDDNPNTRLPMGFSASSDANYGYVLGTSELFDKVYDMAKAALSAGSSEALIRRYMRYEYGVYDWEYDMSSRGPGFMDTVYVLAAVRGLRKVEDADPMGDAEAILEHYRTFGEYGFVLPPRKYFKGRNDAGNFVDIPIGTPIHEFLEDQYLDHNEIYALETPSLADVAVDQNNPLYSTYRPVLDYNGNNFIDDMNGYDSSGYEDVYRSVVQTAEGNAIASTEPMFIDISSLNPGAEELHELKFSIQGYNTNVNDDYTLRTLGVGAVPGGIIQNPYNRSEVLVSIPKYAQAIDMMNADKWESTPVKYLYKIDAITTTTGSVLIRGNDFKVGERIAVFTPDAENYDVQNEDGTWSTVLKVDSIKTGTRPTIFTVSSVSGDTVRVNGLKFEQTMTFDGSSGITFFRLNSFADSGFTQNGQALYMTDRRYTVTMMNYDLVYDRIVKYPSFSTAVDEDDYDGWYISNESVTLPDGTQVDSGFFMPVHDAGSLSELVRTRITEYVQFTFLEYNVADINPVLVEDELLLTSEWTYSVPLAGGVYANTVPAQAYVMYTGTDVQGWNLAVPKGLRTGTLTDDNVTLDVPAEFDDVLMNDSEMMQVRYNNYVLRGIHNSVTELSTKGTTYDITAYNLGAEESMKNYVSGMSMIPVDQFSDSYTVQPTEYSTLLGA